MKRKNKERFCTQYMMQQYDELLACEKLGYYNKRDTNIVRSLEEIFHIYY